MKTINIADMKYRNKHDARRNMSDKDDSKSVTPVDETLPDDELEEVTGGASAGRTINPPPSRHLYRCEGDKMTQWAGRCSHLSEPGNLI